MTRVRFCFLGYKIHFTLIPIMQVVPAQHCTTMYLWEKKNEDEKQFCRRFSIHWQAAEQRFNNINHHRIKTVSITNALRLAPLTLNCNVQTVGLHFISILQTPSTAEHKKTDGNGINTVRMRLSGLSHRLKQTSNTGCTDIRVRQISGQTPNPKEHRVDSISLNFAP